jgi:hypothetical protein
MKGGVFKSRMTWLSDKQSAEDKQKLLAALTPEAKAICSGMVLAGNWYPFAALVDIDRTLMNLFGGGKAEFLRDLGRYSSRINLSGTYRAFDRNTNHEFFRNSALLHSQFQDFGNAVYEQTGPSAGKMVHSDYVCYSRIYCESALGYYEGCIMSHGAASSSVKETECQAYGDKTCTFELAWT